MIKGSEFLFWTFFLCYFLRKDRMKVGLIAIARMENSYIKEFCDYYLNLEFDNIIIYDNKYYVIYNNVGYTILIL